MNFLCHFRLWIIAIMVFTVACASTQNPQQKKKAEAARNLGEAYLREGDFTQALQELLKAESLNPDDPYLQNDIGLTYYGKRRYDEAIRHYKKALDLKSDYAPAMNNLGNAYMAQKKWDSAIEYYEKALESALYATPHFSLSNLGAAYYEKKEYQLSEKYYLEALDLQSDFVQALRGLARTYMAVGRLEDAIFRLKKAVRISPDVALLHYELGNAYRLAGYRRDARDAYQEAIRLAPESTVADEARLGLKKLN